MPLMFVSFCNSLAIETHIARARIGLSVRASSFIRSKINDLVSLSKVPLEGRDDVTSFFVLECWSLLNLCGTSALEAILAPFETLILSSSPIDKVRQGESPAPGP